MEDGDGYIREEDGLEILFFLLLSCYLCSFYLVKNLSKSENILSSPSQINSLHLKSYPTESVQQTIFIHIHIYPHTTRPSNLIILSNHSTLLHLINMPSTSTLSRSPPHSHPRALHTSSKSPSKLPLAYPSPYQSTYRSGSALTGGHSPPSYYPSSVASTSAVPSLVSDYGSSAAGSIHSASAMMSDGDLLDMLDVKLSHSIKSEPLDRGIARQAQA